VRELVGEVVAATEACTLRQRVEGRYGFAVLRPQAFVKVDLTA